MDGLGLTIKKLLLWDRSSVLAAVGRLQHPERRLPGHGTVVLEAKANTI